MMKTSVIPENEKFLTELERGKMRGSIAKLTFPIYEKCAHLVNDEFWCQIFKDLSVGKSPISILID